MIIYKIVKYNVERKCMSLSNHSNNTVAKDSQSMISISLLFFITQTPAVVISILRNSIGNEPKSKEYLMTFNVVSSIMFSISSAIAFLGHDFERNWC